MTSIFPKLLSLGVAFLAGGVIGAELRIRSVDEFIEFKNNVNRGTNFEGTTVFLDSDLSLARKAFEPIGYYNSQDEFNYFSGVFDGQGHVISNLAMNSTSQHAGLFGFSTGLTTIKNVILDPSCSITSSYSGSSYAYIGGIIGQCWANNGPCTIENSVNMGSVAFSGNASGDYAYLYLGGIAGRLSSFFNNITVKNCANYGDVTHSGKSRNSYIGGIVGDSGSSSSYRTYIYNSLNQGTITHSGTTGFLWLGGITGFTKFSAIENCVSGGKISLLTTASEENYIGSIVGQIYSYETSINYTYFTSDLSGYNKYGQGTPTSESNTLSYDSTTFELNGTVSIGGYSSTSLVGALNAVADYYTLCDYSHWLLNKGNNAVSFTINGNSPFTLNTQVILLPNLASEGESSFDGWYNDKNCTVPFEKTAVEEGVALYGKYVGELSIAPSLFPYATLLLSFLISLVAF